jgi:hypothetical protein
MNIARPIYNFFQWLGRSTVWPGRPTRGLLSLITLSLTCALWGISGAVACSPTAAGAPPSQTQAYTFYIFNPFAENKLAPLDPETLDDQPDGRPLEPGRFSVSGSTRVDVEYPPGHDVNNPGPNPDDIWIVIRDLQTGTERSRFHPPVPGLIPLLSQDGTRLVIQPYPSTGYPLIAEWYVVDTTTGQSLAHIKDADTSCFRGGTGLFDPALQQRVYCPVEPDIAEANGPEPLRIIAYDLESGEKAAEVELPEVLIGSRQTERTVNGQPVWAFLEPAVALSPDGQQLAVVHADTDKVTLIEAEPLTVERTLALNHPTSLWDWFAPAVAQAKGPSEGTIREAVFSPGGQYLYVFSQESWVRPEDAPAARGLWLVDLTQGDIVAEVLSEFQIQWVRPAPDGSVYVFGTTDERLGPHEIRPTSPSMLWRLDALSLETLAQREFTGYQGGRLVLGQPAE